MQVKNDIGKTTLHKLPSYILQIHVLVLSLPIIWLTLLFVFQMHYKLSFMALRDPYIMIYLRCKYAMFLYRCQYSSQCNDA